MNVVARRTAWTLATWFGCGLVPHAPGTMGALGALPLYLVIARGGRAGVAITALGVIVAGVWASSIVAREIGRKDPQLVVVDEVAGLLVTMSAVPAPSWRGVVVGFALFRVLDIAKPWPVRHFEKLPSGWGIVMDDVAAGALGACAMSVLRLAGVLP
jgi:phosphatidylglycerophosphatase A